MQIFLVWLGIGGILKLGSGATSGIGGTSIPGTGFKSGTGCFLLFSLEFFTIH